MGNGGDGLDLVDTDESYRPSPSLRSTQTSDLSCPVTGVDCEAEFFEGKARTSSTTLFGFGVSSGARARNHLSVVTRAESRVYTTRSKFRGITTVAG